MCAEKGKISLVCFLLLLKRDKNVWHWQSLSPPFGDPWPSCLLPSHNQSILKEITPEYLLERLMLKMKLQSFGHLMQWTDSFEKTWCWERSKAGGEGDDWGWDSWMASPTQWTWVWVGSRSWCWTGRPGVLRFMGLQRVGHYWVTELNWTEAKRRSAFFTVQLSHPYMTTDKTIALAR